MADVQPGQQWRHGWIPLTPAAARSKNHGRKPAKNSALSRIVAEAAEAAKTLRQNAQSAAGPDGTPPPKWTGLGDRKPATLKGKTPTKAASPPAKSPKAAAPLSARADDALRTMAGRPSKKSSRNAAADDDDSGFPPGVHGLSGNLKMLRTGDTVEVTVGDHDGKTGKVVGKGGDGEIKVDFGGGKIATVNASDVDQKRAADTKTSTGQAAPKPKTPEPAKTQPAKPGGGKVSDAQTESKIVGFLEGAPRGKWTTMTALREQMGGIPRDQQDNVLRTMMLAGRVDMEPAAIPGNLKPEDRAAAITIGNRSNHQVRLSY